MAEHRGRGRIGPVSAAAPGAFPAWLASADPSPDDRFWLAAVAPPASIERLTRVLDRSGGRLREIRTGTPRLPVAPAYPGLGVDRWLAMQPLWQADRRAFCLVDAGTATTIDVVDSNGRHLGGWIFPGPDAARGGLLSAAPGLSRPPSGQPARPGPARDTGSAVDNGLLLQQLGAVERALAELDGLLGSEAPALVLTGGAAGSLQSHLGQARLEPDLVLRGLAMAVEQWSNR